jgi:hypothetical protein
MRGKLIRNQTVNLANLGNINQQYNSILIEERANRKPGAILLIQRQKESSRNEETDN